MVRSTPRQCPTNWGRACQNQAGGDFTTLPQVKRIDRLALPSASPPIVRSVYGRTCSIPGSRTRSRLRASGRAPSFHPPQDRRPPLRARPDVLRRRERTPHRRTPYCRTRRPVLVPRSRWTAAASLPTRCRARMTTRSFDIWTPLNRTDLPDRSTGVRRGHIGGTRLNTVVHFLSHGGHSRSIRDNSAVLLHGDSRASLSGTGGIRSTLISVGSVARKAAPLGELRTP